MIREPPEIKYDTYPDKGCEYHPVCATCPFALDEKGECLKDWNRYERAEFFKGRTIAERNAQIIHQSYEGSSGIVLSRRFGLSGAQISRIIKGNCEALLPR